MRPVILGFGSNIEDRLEYIKSSYIHITESGIIHPLMSSSVYETEPWGYSEQDFFFNTVLSAETNLDVQTLFSLLKEIEKSTGRSERKKWHKREIDIDILFFGDSCYNDDELIVPHEHLHSRNFVLVPLNEIYPGFIHPVFKKNISELLKNTPDKSGINLKYESNIFNSIWKRRKSDI